jgi:diguanylate cyclase
MSNGTSRPGSDWKNKYLAALEQQEKKDQQFKQLTSLLSRAVLRLSLMADGVDLVLDKQLEGLRKLLREDSLSRKDLDTLVSALDGQAKRMDDVKSQRSSELQKAFESLANQLRKLKPESEAEKRLKVFKKSLKGRVGHIHSYERLVKDYADLQAETIEQVLAQSGDGGESFWKGLFGKKAGPAELAEAQAENSELLDHPVVTASAEPRDVPAEPEWMEEAPDLVDPRPALSHIKEEPSFSRLNQSVCLVLSELLHEVGESESAKEAYATATQQIERGLNWFELVPTLEDISLVVMAALDRDQHEFEAYLQQLNERLSGAHSVIAESQRVGEEGFAAGRRLQSSVQEQVNMMQDSVANAAGLDQLKTEVSSRLDSIVGAMDQFAAEEQQHQQSLSDQLNDLVSRVKQMEDASAEAEKQIEEQRQRALRDVLTQLPNREAYLQRVEQEQQRWQRYDRPLAMIVTDIDKFKRINDTYGHLAGDKVLRIIAKTLAKRLRKTDFIARFGGEEFVILMPETTRDQAFAVIEKVREAIAQCPFHFREEPVTITSSFGVAAFEEGDDHEQVFARADKALYKAKEQGRNCSVLA